MITKDSLRKSFISLSQHFSEQNCFLNLIFVLAVCLHLIKLSLFFIVNTLLSMKSKISFYSFKESEHSPGIRRLRKDQQSYFDEFQKLRIRQKLREEGSTKKAVSVSVLVRSEKQMQLLNFLQLPKVQRSKSRKRREQCMQKAEMVSKTPLQKILSNKSKFLRTYFSRLRGFEDKRGTEEVKHVFPEIGAGEWRVRGYLMGEHILLKATHPSGRERYLKYKYLKYVEEIKTSYEEFAREKFQDYLALDP